MRAVAYCATTHSYRFGDQIPTRSPVRTPRAMNAARGQVDLLPELAVGRPEVLVAHDERLAVAEPLDRPPQVLADRLAEQRDVARPVLVRKCGSNWATDPSAGQLISVMALACS